VAAVLAQAGPLVTGTLAVGGDPAMAGAYLVQGRATPKRREAHGVAQWCGRLVGCEDHRRRPRFAGSVTVPTLMPTTARRPFSRESSRPHSQTSVASDHAPSGRNETRRDPASGLAGPCR
jgi:hypothetical protein